MTTTTYGNIFQRKLGAHHFAYLRALAEGLDPAMCSQRYLGTANAQESREAHKEVVETARAVARRHPEGRSAWRLIGIRVTPKAAPRIPTLAEFIEAMGYQDWSEEDCNRWYLDEYPAQANKSALKRRQRLFRRQISIINLVESTATSSPSPRDAIDGWFDTTTTERLAAIGIQTLEDLTKKIRSSQAWHADAPSIGSVKARAIEEQMERLIPAPPLLSFSLPPSTDHDLVESWLTGDIAASTAERYRRELLRFRLWLNEARPDARLLDVCAYDISAYSEFLGNLPAHWVSESLSRVSTLSSGWTPFKEQPSKNSQAESISAVSAFYTWLTQSGQIEKTPFGAPKKAGRPRGGSNPFQAKTKAIQIRIASTPPSPEKSLVACIISIMETMEISAQTLIKLQTNEVTPNNAGGYTLITKRTNILLSAKTSSLLNEYLSWNHDTNTNTSTEAPLLRNPRFPARGLSYRSLCQLINKWSLAESTSP